MEKEIRQITVWEIFHHAAKNCWNEWNEWKFHIVMVILNSNRVLRSKDLDPQTLKAIDGDQATSAILKMQVRNVSYSTG